MAPVTRYGSRRIASSSKRTLEHQEPSGSSTANDSPLEEQVEPQSDEPINVQVGIAELHHTGVHERVGNIFRIIGVAKAGFERCTTPRRE